MEDILEFAKKLLELNQLNVTEIKLPVSKDIPMFDLGLRNFLYSDAAYREFYANIQETYKERTVYYIKDSYQCNYVILRLPINETVFFMAGPYVYKTIDDLEYISLAKKLNFPLDIYHQLRHYYKGITVLNNDSILLNFFSAFASEIYGGDNNYKVINCEYTVDNSISYEKYQVKVDNSFAIKELEKRYENMGKLLNEVRRGNSNGAILYLDQFLKIAGQPRFSNMLRDTKNWLIIFNTSLRMTAESVQIHPIYLDEISSNFSHKIDALTNSDLKFKMMHEMIRRYCLMINNCSTSMYPPLIQKAVIFVSTNLVGDLSLKSISKQLNVNGSYLSKLFKKEMGVTLTEYVNKKRIEESLHYLNSSNENIKNIICLVGIYDLNYYTKLFKRFIGMTPTQYCNTIGRIK